MASMGTIFCLFCGCANHEGEKHCRECGKFLPRRVAQNSSSSGEKPEGQYLRTGVEAIAPGSGISILTAQKAIMIIAGDFMQGHITREDYQKKVDRISELIGSVTEEFALFLAKVEDYKKKSPDHIYNYLDIYLIEARDLLEGFKVHFTMAVDHLGSLKCGDDYQCLKVVLNHVATAVEKIESLDQLTEKTDSCMRVEDPAEETIDEGARFDGESSGRYL